MMEQHQKVYKIASTLLQYPTEEWLRGIEDIKLELKEMDDSFTKMYLNSFLFYVESTPFDELCEKYVATFDYHGIVTLHLTYHVFKDSRKRGEALVKLRNVFNESQFETITEELPDYLPLILEFLSVANEDQMQQVLKLHYKSMEKLHDDLMREDSEYHFILKAINTVSEEKLKNVS
mgnify:FL=1